MASIATGSEVEWTEEKNYHFRMKAMRDRLLHWVRHNLEDLSISRPVTRLDWGIRVPDDPSQTIYVWVDALINYLTKAGFPAWAPGDEHRGGWPADVHVIGKDIVRFHGVYWPALLLAVGLPPPKQLLSHAHWTLGKKKMSKSVGNVVNPFQAIERWDLDTMRYVMLRDGGLENDADYENRFIFARYEKDLQWTLGNALSRITRSTKWHVADARPQPNILNLAHPPRSHLPSRSDHKARSRMRLNEKTAIATPQVTLVPYEARHVAKYHRWMSDPDIQAATASDPLSLEEEYENQASWRTADDKLTFIICRPLAAGAASTEITAGTADHEDAMVGDPPDFVGEIDVMVAEKGDRGRGVGFAAVTALMEYVLRHVDDILREHGPRNGARVPRLRGLMAKIQAGNDKSMALFQRVGFTQKGGVNYFGEMEMVLDRFEERMRSGELAWRAELEETYRELVYTA
ncbi:hypothetical protein VdG1_05413 [Verticillium dahliae VDG1]|nr:hypothetical protein VdG1_05413 [Verticillium dahliae VDG1]